MSDEHFRSHRYNLDFHLRVLQVDVIGGVRHDSAPISSSDDVVTCLRASN
jgi:hypothetical protein